jgi:glycosyltransferase involved in cell wall biosynthesis
MLSGYLIALPSAILTRTPIVLAERNSPDVYELTRAKKYKRLYFYLMRFASVITVQLEVYKKRYPEFLQRKIQVIHNEILISPKTGNRIRAVRPFTFGFVGRLCHQKQPIRLLESFARHISAGYDSRLIFFGQGELGVELRSKISHLQLEDLVTISEPIRNLDEIYNLIDALCLPSLWEGFPNVVGEAMTYGLPILGNRNCFGLSELVTERVGLLVDFEDENSDGFLNLISLFRNNQLHKLEIIEHINKLQDHDFVELWNQVTLDATK